ncbi:ABC transporter permease [Neobacillus mesonae]|nr:ABC transporter permease [Neobacillus mesonae]
MDLQQLWKTRRSAFWSKITPYLGYVLQSGVAVILGFSLIAFSAWYTSLVQDIPSGFPIRWVMLIVLVPPVIFSSYRTYLHQADIVFLRPQEYRMQLYLQKSFTRGIVYKSIGLILLFILLWPLYIRSEAEPKPFLLFLILLLLLKYLASYGGWCEQQMLSKTARMSYRLLRYAVIIMAIYAWVWHAVIPGLIFIAILAALYLVTLRLPVRLPVPWEYLIETEQLRSARVMKTLGFFVEVPALKQRVHARRWLSPLAERIPWGQHTAFQYLITKTFIRSDLLGICIRLAIVAAFFIYWTGNSLWGSGVYLFFLFLLGVQLSGLSRYHRDSFWIYIYPVTAESRRTQVLKFVYTLQTALTLLLWIPLIIGGWGRWVELAITLALGLLIAHMFRSSQMKKWSKEEEME